MYLASLCPSPSPWLNPRNTSVCAQENTCFPLFVFSVNHTGFTSELYPERHYLCQELPLTRWKVPDTYLLNTREKTRFNLEP